LGNCFSSWAFAAIGSIESSHSIETGELVSLSEQQLMDCAGKQYGAYGCYGGYVEAGYKYFMDGHFAELESVYPPYTSGKTSKQEDCRYDAEKATGITTVSYDWVTPNSVS
jgi:cathepsin L